MNEKFNWFFNGVLYKLGSLNSDIRLSTLSDNNSFILSEDRRVFNKLIARTLLYNQTQDIPGDIVECGVFKGTGLYTFLKLKNIFNPNSSKKVIGFDFFNTDTLISSIKDKIDKEAIANGWIGNKQMATLQERYDDLSSAYEYIVTKYDKEAEILASMCDCSVKEISATLDTQQKEKDDAIAKIWKHYRDMWT